MRKTTTHTQKKSKKVKKMRKTRTQRKGKKTSRTRKNRGGSPSPPYQTINDSLLSKKIPQAVIDYEINKYLSPIDNYTLYDTSIIDFIPKIVYEFYYDEVSHLEDDYLGASMYGMHDPVAPLDNTRFDDITKKEVDDCIRLHAAQYEMDNNDGLIVNKTPTITVIVRLSMGKQDTRARIPRQRKEIIINSNPENYNHEVELHTDFYDEPIDIVCDIPLFAHETY